MHTLLQVLSTVPPKSSVPDVVFSAVGAIAGALDEEFEKYMEPFSPFLNNALGNQEEPGLCSMAIGLVSDISRALNEKISPYCDTFMNHLMNNLSVSRPCSIFTVYFSNFIYRVPQTSSSPPFSRRSEILPRLLACNSINT